MIPQSAGMVSLENNLLTIGSHRFQLSNVAGVRCVELDNGRRKMAVDTGLFGLVVVALILYKGAILNFFSLAVVVLGMTAPFVVLAVKRRQYALVIESSGLPSVTLIARDATEVREAADMVALGMKNPTFFGNLRIDSVVLGDDNRGAGSMKVMGDNFGTMR